MRCHGSAEVVTGGRPDGGNFAGVATRAQSKGDLAEDGPDRWAPAGSDWGEHGIRAETL
jgi:triacylglycerol esterase/lipase EstA (alpha/beta hydrolase family)